MDIVDMYEVGAVREDISQATGLTQWALRNMLAVLNLRWQKKHRVKDLAIFKKRLAEYDGQDADILDELSKDVQLLQDELNKNTRTIQHLRDSNLLLRKQVRTAAREDYFDSLLLKELKEQFDNLEPPVVNLSAVEPSENGTMFMVLSDTHHNEKVDSSINNGFNEYNDGECRQRILKLVQRMTTSGDNAQSLRVYLLGDLLHGLIHHGDLTGEAPAMEALVEFSEFLATIFKALGVVYKDVKILMVNGNHSRLTDNQKIHQKAYDLEYLVYNYLKLKLETSDIEITYSNTGYLVDIVGETKIGLFHGDMTRNYNGFDFGNSYRVYNIFKTLYNTDVTHLFSGHTHRPVMAANQFGGFNVVNGCVSGTNEYGMSLGLPPIEPVQYFGRFDEDGRIASISPVILS